MVRISLRQEVMEVPPQDVITRDNVTIKVNAVVTLRVVDPNLAVVKVANYAYQTSQFAQTTLRSVLGEVELDELLSHRDKLNLRIQGIIDQRTEPFGVKVSPSKSSRSTCPNRCCAPWPSRPRPSAKRAPRSSTPRANSTPRKSWSKPRSAGHRALTMQLRYLQTLTEIGVEKNTTIVFPLPVDILSLMREIPLSIGNGYENCI
jgi:hypothetical protein